MRKVVLSVVITSVLGISVFAQERIKTAVYELAIDRVPLVLAVEANLVERVPPDGDVKTIRVHASGNVVLTLSGGIRVMAESAVVPLASNVIELNGGVKIELRDTPTMVRTVER
jgi:hypothetical protein